MYKYIKYYDMGYKDGMSMAIKDSLTNTYRKFRIIKTDDLKSKLYDIGYLDGYSIIEKLTLKTQKNVV